MVLIISGLLMVGILFSAANWASVYYSWRNKRFYSPIPIFGAWFLGLGLAGFQATRPFWWLCFILDYGTLTLLLAIPSMLYEAWSMSWINRLHRFYALENGRETTISLFRRGVALVQMKFDSSYRDKVRGGPVALSRPCKWRKVDDMYELNGLYDRRVIRIKPIPNCFICEDVVESGVASGYDALGGIRLEQQ